MGKKAPKAPDPYATAAAQGGMNRDTAMSQQLINMTNTVNPWGSTSYSPNGETSFVDSTGKTISVPQFTQTTTYTPEQQAIFDQSQQAQTNLAQTAANQSAAVQDTLSNPFQFDNQAAADWAYDLGQSRIAPQQQMAQRDLQNQLVNSGLRPGTAAWDREMQRMTNANTDQNNQLALQGRGQAFNEALTTRQQPLNELNALLTSSQQQNPGAMSPGTPQASVGGVDYTGLVNQKYQGDLANYQSKMGALGGLFGLAGQAAIASDIRLKTDIERVGVLDNGLPVYSYRYIDGGPIHIGVMAQDVEKVNPSAVEIMENGYMAVDYAEAVR